MDPKNNPAQPAKNAFFNVGLPTHLPPPSSFLPPWHTGGSNPLFLQSMVVGGHPMPTLHNDSLQASAVQALQRVKSPEAPQNIKNQYDSDDDDVSSVDGGGRKKSRKDDNDGSGNDEDRTKKRREQIAAASRASRARRKRELEDLRAETKQLKEEKESLVETVRKLQKRIEDLQDRPLKLQESANKSMAIPRFPNVVSELGKTLSSVTALLTVIRSKQCSPSEYVRCSDRLCRLLVEEAIALSRIMHPTSVVTPTNAEAHGLEYPDFTRECCAVTIMRSGDIIGDAMKHVIPTVPIGKLLIQRQEHLPDKAAVLHWSKLPSDIGNRFVFVCDPMLGTGGTIVTCLQELVKYKVNPKNILFLNVVSCPEGLARLQREFPEVKVVTCAVDDCLNDKCYIVPGLGDYGDRYYHTT